MTESLNPSKDSKESKVESNTAAALNSTSKPDNEIGKETASSTPSSKPKPKRKQQVSFVKKLMRKLWRWFKRLFWFFFFLGLLLWGESTPWNSTTYRDITVTYTPLYYYLDDKLYDYYYYSEPEKIFEGGIPNIHDAPKIGVLYLNGTIVSSCAGGALALETEYICADIVGDFLDMVYEDSTFVGLLIVLNTPGGEAYASKALFNKVYRLRPRIPVYVFVPDMMASGGVFMGVGAEQILAANESMIGNIGVVAQLMDMDGLFNKLGIKTITYTSSNAKYKTMEGLYDNDRDDPEDQVFQDILDVTEKSFHEAILKGRGSRVDMEQVKNGLIFSAPKALEYGLIDQIVEDEQEALTVLLRNAYMRGKEEWHQWDPGMVVRVDIGKNVSVFDQLLEAPALIYNAVFGNIPVERVRIILK